MSQTSHLKSAAITNLDASPPLRNDTGIGAATSLKQVDGFVTPLAADTTGSTYQLVRIPTNAIVKSLVLTNEAQGAGKVDLSVYYSDAPGNGNLDGTAPSNSGIIVPTTGASFFSGDIDLTSDIQPTEKVFANMDTSGAYTPALAQEPLWQALGLATDPGGWFDIVAVVHTTAITTGTGVLYVSCQYTI